MMFFDKLSRLSINMGIPEGLFIENNRPGIEAITGVAPSELRSVTSLTLPPFIHRHTSNAIEGTLLDHRERGAEYGFKRGELVARSGALGTSYNPRTRMASVESSTGIIESIWRVLKDDPVLVDFHTHPTLTLEYFKSIGRTVVNTRVGLLNVRDLCDLSKPTHRYFSHIDLGNLEIAKKLLRSMLLGSDRGYLWIINPNPRMQIITGTKAAQRYDKARLDFLKNEANKKRANPEYLPDFQEFDDRIQKLTIQFCQENGFQAFINTDYKDPTLTRLN